MLLAGNGSGRPRSEPAEWKMRGRYSPSFSMRDEFWKREIMEALPWMRAYEMAHTWEANKHSSGSLVGERGRQEGG